MKRIITLAMVLFILNCLGSVCSAITTERYNLTVGKTMTLFLNASEAVTGAAWISTEPSSVVITSQNSVSCSIKVEKVPDASPVIVYCDYKYTYSNPYNGTMHIGSGRKDFYIYVIDNGSGSDSGYVTITFDPMGGTASFTSVSRPKDGQYGTLPTAVKAGYTFKGWYTDDRSSPVKLESNYLISSLKCYSFRASWASNTYTIRFNGNGNTGGSMSSMECLPGTAYALNSNTFTKTGCRFVCWNTKADGTGVDYDNNESVESLVGAGNSITLYAVWATANKQIQYCDATLDTSSYTYDGKDKTPGVTVKDGRTKLTQGTHYKLTYKDNTNGGTATVTVQGIGNYSGSKDLSFTINKAEQTVTAAIASGSQYIVKGKSAAMKASGYGTISYASANTSIATVSADGLVTGMSEGTTTITVTANGDQNYKAASTKVTVTIDTNLGTDAAGENIIWTISGGQLKLMGTGPMLNWPRSGRTFTAEHAPWYDRRDEITSITLSEGITTVSDKAFIDCANAKYLTVPKSVTSIGSGAFKGMDSLQSLTIPFVGGSRTATGSGGLLGYMFGNAGSNATGTMLQYYSSTSKTYWYIPQTLRTVTVTDATRLSYGAFYGCSMLTQITLPGSVTSIGDEAFYNCSGMTEMALSGNLTSIGRSAFYGCSKLITVAIPKSVTSVESSAFENCSELAGVYIDDVAAWCRISFGGSTANPLYYAKKLYLNNTEVKKLSVPSGVTKIGQYAFYNAAGITGVTLPSGLESIEYGAFNNCASVQTLTVPKTVTSIDGGALKGMDSLQSLTIPFVGGSRTATGSAGVLGYLFGNTSSSTTGTTRQYYAASSSYYYYIPQTLQTVTVTDDSTLPYGAFYGCSMLTQITLPGSVTNIADKAFYNCSGISALAMGDKLTSIGVSAFYGCSKLVNVTIPKSVTSIGSSAFENCTTLGGVYISDMAAWCRISFGSETGNPLYCAKKLYLNDAEVKVLSVPSDVIEIKNYAFYNAGGITSVTLPSGLKSIGYSAFYNCGGIQTLTVPNSVTSIGGSAFRCMNSLQSLTIPFVGGSRTATGSSGVLGYVFGSTGSSATGTTLQYYSESSKSYYYIPQTLQTVKVTDDPSLSYGSFYNCLRLTQITLPENVTSIGGEAFRGCTGLTQVSIPADVKTVGSGAFESCTGLKGVYISDIRAWCGIGFSDETSNPLYYAKKLYVNNVLVTALDISWGTLSITRYAFVNCTGIKTVTVPKTVSSIGRGAFKGLSALTAITLPFVGASREANTGANSVLGYIFDYSTGTSSGAVQQYYSDSGSIYCYIPATLKTVTVTDATLLSYGAFNNTKKITKVRFECDLSSIGDKAFKGDTLTVQYPSTWDSSLQKKKTSYGGTKITWKQYSAVSIDGAQASAVMDQTYTGMAIEPIFTVNNGGTALSEGTQYIVEWKNNLNAGIATATVYGCGTCIGSFSFDFNILPRGIDEVAIADIPDDVYTGVAVDPGLTLTFNGRQLVPGTDYIAGYTLDDAGKLSFTISGKGNYAGVSKRSFNVFRVPAALTQIGEEAFSGIDAEIVYIHSGVKKVSSKAFANCRGLKRIHVASADTSVADDFVSGCAKTLIIEAPAGSDLEKRLDLLRSFLY